MLTKSIAICLFQEEMCYFFPPFVRFSSKSNQSLCWLNWSYVCNTIFETIKNIYLKFFPICLFCILLIFPQHLRMVQECKNNWKQTRTIFKGENLNKIQFQFSIKLLKPIKVWKSYFPQMHSISISQNLTGAVFRGMRTEGFRCQRAFGSVKYHMTCLSYCLIQVKAKLKKRHF